MILDPNNVFRSVVQLVVVQRMCSNIGPMMTGLVVTLKFGDLIISEIAQQPALMFAKILKSPYGKMPETISM